MGKLARTEKRMSRETDVYGLLQTRDVHDCLAKTGVPYRILGVVAADAITHAAKIHWDTQEIELGRDAALSSRRRWGRRQSLDTLALTTDWSETDDVRSALDDTVGDQLAVSVAGLEEPAAGRSLLPNMDVTSRRTVEGESDGRLVHRVVLDHVEVRLPDGWYDPWRVVPYGESDGEPLFLTVSPTAVEADYRMHSLAGIAPKHRSEFENLRKRLDSETKSQPNRRLPHRYATQHSIGEAFHHTVESGARDRHTWFGARALVLRQLEALPVVRDL